MVAEEFRESAAAEEAAFSLLLLAERIAVLAEVEWHSPAATLYRTCIRRLSAECDSLRVRLTAYIPPPL